MRKINLKSGTRKVKTRKSTGNGSLAFGIILIVASLISYGAIFNFQKEVDKEKADFEEKIENIKKRLDGGEFEEVYNFQDRLIELKGMVSGKVSQSDFLGVISVNTLSNVNFVNISQDIKGGLINVSASLRAPNYDVISRQLDLYGNVDGIYEVSMTGSKQKDNNIETEIHFVMNSGLVGFNKVKKDDSKSESSEGDPVKKDK